MSKLSMHYWAQNMGLIDYGFHTFSFLKKNAQTLS